jgi:nucleoside diphosphate kinase
MRLSSFSLFLFILLTFSFLEMNAQVTSNQRLHMSRGSNLNERLEMSPGSNLNERLEMSRGFVPGTINPIEQTLAIINPEAVQSNRIGQLIARFERSDLRIGGIKMVKLTRNQASQFYAVYQGRPFYSALVEFMSSGPLVVMVIEGENAITRSRQLMNTLNPVPTERGNRRTDFVLSVNRQGIHASIDQQAARQEIQFFFRQNEIFFRF